jgi:hypothetical protein
MYDTIITPEEKILENLCIKYGVKQELIHELLLIEKGYQDHAKRRGIYQQITELIKMNMDK